jgi:thioredoxin 1
VQSLRVSAEGGCSAGITFQLLSGLREQSLTFSNVFRYYRTEILPFFAKTHPMSAFSDIINSDTPALVDFYAEWCGPCKTMKPILDDLKSKVGSTAKIIKIDIDKNPKAAGAYGIRSVPTLILFKKGQIVWRQSGVVPATELQKIIRQHM